MLKTQYRLALPFSLLPAAAFLLLAPLVLSLRNLDSSGAARAVENYFALCGILLLTPLAQPEQDRRIREVVASKPLNALGVLLLRFLAVLALLPLLALGFCLALLAGGSAFAFWPYLVGAFATAFFLGALGFAFALIAGNWLIGYIASLCYFALNYGLGQKLGPFYLFTLARLGMAEKYCLLASGALLAGAAFLWRLGRDRFLGKT